jgi:hypothetical protein
MPKVIEALTIDGLKPYIQHQGSVIAIPDGTPERVIKKALQYPKIGEILFIREGIKSGNLTTR